MTDDILDVAIIGAGIAGTYCAYRLQQDTDLSITVFEANARVGGRLWSHHWEEADAVVELGGEGFSPYHAHVASLAYQELGLNIVPHNAFNSVKRLNLRGKTLHPEDFLNRTSFPTGGAAAMEAKLRYYVGPEYFIHPEGAADDQVEDLLSAVAHNVLNRLSPNVADAFSPLIKAAAARNKVQMEKAADRGSPNSLPVDLAMTSMTSEIFSLVNALIEAVEAATVAFKGTEKRILGDGEVRAYELDFWSFLINDLGQEAYELYRNSGYDNTSALSFNLVELCENLLLNALMGFANPGFWTIEGGYDQLPKALLERSCSAPKVQYRDQMTLVNLVRDDSQDLTRLTFHDATGAEHHVQARQVVYTAPVCLFDGQVGLHGFDPDLTQQFQTIRKGVTSVPAGKLYLAFPNTWWTEMDDLGDDPDPLFGYATTDMPPQAFYYKGHCGDGKRGLMAGALADASSLDFWSGFLSPSAAAYPGTTEADRHTLGAPRTMVHAAHEMLDVIHSPFMPRSTPDKPARIPIPDLALFFEWRENGAAWSAWKSGRNIHEDAAKLRRPFTEGTVDQKLYCCGDSVAERHGWVENTIDSAERMLREGFGLDRASWLP